MYEVNFEEVIHCGTQEEAKEILVKVTDRFEECGLRVHPQKTKIVYCKKEGRKLKRLPVQFDFLGFSFRPIMTRLRKGGSFLPSTDVKFKNQRIYYHGKIKRNSLKPVFYYLHHSIIKWILNKYKWFKRSRVLAVKWLRHITRDYPNMFYHWSLGYQLT